MKKVIKKVILILVILILIVSTFVFIKGYNLYNKTIKNTNISEKVSQIQNAEYFVPINEIPKDYINAVIAVEDHRFYEHGAIDVIAITRAVTSNFKNKELTEGGSTITQQVAKNLYFMTKETKDDSLDRKVAEILIGIYLENNYTKDQIFELYVNNIYFGDGYYCIKDATEGYFNKEPDEMNLYECTLLAGIPNAPSVYSPNVNPELSKKRQEKVIKSMVKYGYLEQSIADQINLNEYKNTNENK